MKKLAKTPGVYLDMDHYDANRSLADVAKCSLLPTADDKTFNK
ncbi:hypothetical protein [Kaarinaea lacus]